MTLLENHIIQDNCLILILLYHNWNSMGKGDEKPVPCPYIREEISDIIGDIQNWIEEAEI